MLAMHLCASLGLQMVVSEASTFREESFLRVCLAKPSLLQVFWIQV